MATGEIGTFYWATGEDETIGGIDVKYVFCSDVKLKADKNVITYYASDLF